MRVALYEAAPQLVHRATGFGLWVREFVSAASSAFSPSAPRTAYTLSLTFNQVCSADRLGIPKRPGSLPCSFAQPISSKTSSAMPWLFFRRSPSWLLLSLGTYFRQLLTFTLCRPCPSLSILPFIRAGRSFSPYCLMAVLMSFALRRVSSQTPRILLSSDYCALSRCVRIYLLSLPVWPAHRRGKGIVGLLHVNRRSVTFSGWRIRSYRP
jgi:hypothetical protein